MRDGLSGDMLASSWHYIVIGRNQNCINEVHCVVFGISNSYHKLYFNVNGCYVLMPANLEMSVMTIIFC